MNKDNKQRAKAINKLNKFFKHPFVSLRDIYLKRFRLKNYTNIQANLSQLVTFKENYPVNSLKYEDEYLWPYLRNHLWANINSISLGNYNDYHLKPSRIQGSFIEDFTPNVRNKLINEHNIIHSENMSSLTQSDILFFVMQNATEKLEINGSIYHKYTDHYLEAAANIGSVQKFEVIRTDKLANDWSRYKFPAKLIGISKVDQRDFSSQIEFDDSIFKNIKKYIPIIASINKLELIKIFNYELNVRQYYIELLKLIKPKLIFLNYYHRYAPLISAADKLGIITVDLQHGVQIGWSPLYNNFEEIAYRDYQALPDYFAVYSKREAKNIHKNFSSINKHKPILMGYSWLTNNNTVFKNTEYENFLRNLNSGQKKILLILQKQRYIPPYLLEAIRNTQSRYIWLIRHHPKGHSFNRKDFCNLSNVILHETLDRAPINFLSNYLDMCISEGSVLSLELQILGIPSLIVGKEGRDNYVQEIDSGLLFHSVANSDNIIETLISMETTIQSDRGKISETPTPQKFIIKLLELSESSPYA